LTNLLDVLAKLDEEEKEKHRDFIVNALSGAKALDIYDEVLKHITAFAEADSSESGNKVSLRGWGMEGIRDVDLDGLDALDTLYNKVKKMKTFMKDMRGLLTAYESAMSEAEESEELDIEGDATDASTSDPVRASKGPHNE